MTDSSPELDPGTKATKMKGSKKAARIIEAVIILAFVGVAAVALTSRPSHTVTASAVPTTSTTTVKPAASPPVTTAAPTTAAPTTTPSPTTTTKRHRATTPTTFPHPPLSIGSTTTQIISSPPIAVKGGSFRVTGNNVSLTHVVVAGDTLFGISQWYKLMGGVSALYAWNHSTVGSNPNLIFPGEVLTITVPQQDIPKISPVYLAETVQGSRK